MIRALPDLLSSSLFSRVTSELKSDLERTAIEAVTGQRSDLVEASAGHTGQVHRAQMAIDQSQAIQTRLALVTGRYTQAAASFKSIRTATENVDINALQAATSGDKTGIDTSAQSARNALEAVFTALNTRFDGRSLFAGNAGSNAALGQVDALLAEVDAATAGAATPADELAAIDAYFAPGGGFETSIYQGGDQAAATVTLPDGYSLKAIETANDDSFRKLIQGLTIVAQSYKLPPQEIVDWISQGADLISAAQDELTVKEAALGESLNRLGEAVEQEKDALRLAGETLDRIIGRDTFEAASETQNLETRLQAAYSLSSRLSRLSLTNYIR